MPMLIKCLSRTNVFFFVFLLKLYTQGANYSIIKIAFYFPHDIKAI